MNQHVSKFRLRGLNAQFGQSRNETHRESPSRFIAVLLDIAVNLCISAALGAPISVVDDAGEKIVLEKPVQRIITLAPHLTEQVFTAGGGDRIVATVNYSNFPEAAKQLLTIGSYKKLSFEMVVGLDRDLIFAFGGNGWEMINRLRDLNYTVICR